MVAVKCNGTVGLGGNVLDLRSVGTSVRLVRIPVWVKLFFL